MSERPSAPGEELHVKKHAVVAAAARALDLVKRVPALLKQRGWPHQDLDLTSVIIGAVACRKMQAGATRFRRPRAADGCGGRWPADHSALTASVIIEILDLGQLLHPTDDAR